MKKVKIMLMAICVVAVTGGLVAFKTLVPLDFCSGDATIDGNNNYTCSIVGQPQVLCPDLVQTAITTLEVPGEVFCTIEPVTTTVGGVIVNTCTLPGGAILPCSTQETFGTTLE